MPTETFTGTGAGFADLTWTQLSGSWSRSSGQGTVDGSFVVRYARCESDVGSSNMYAEVEWPVGDTTDDRTLNVGVRFAAAADTGYWLELNDQLNRYRLYRRNAGTDTDIIGNTALTVTPGAGKKIRLEASGSTLTGYWDGTQLFSTTDTNITTGTRGGLSSYNCNGVLKFDNFTVNALSPAVPLPTQVERRPFARKVRSSMRLPLSNLGPVPGALGPFGADFDTRLMMKANPKRTSRGRIVTPAPTTPVVNPNLSRSVIRDTRFLARTALRRGQLPNVPKPQTIAPPPPAPNLVARSQRIGIPRYVRRKPGEALRTFALNSPILPLPWSRKLRRARNFRAYGKHLSAPAPITMTPPPWPPPNVRVRVKPPFPRWMRIRFETVPPQYNPPFLPLVLRESRLKSPYPRYRRTRLEFTPNDQAAAPYFGVSVPRPPRLKRVFQVRPRIAAAPPTQALPVERRPSRRSIATNVRRRGLVAPSADTQPLLRLGKRPVGPPAIPRRVKPTSVPGQPSFSPGVRFGPARRRAALPVKSHQSASPQSPGYTNPPLVSRGRAETPFRAGVALRRGHAATRGSWYNPIAPAFVPKWARTRRMQGLRARLGRGQIIAPVIQVVNDIVFSITPAREAWVFGFTVDDWAFHDDNDNWMFWYAGG